jgi:hypothetical protein
MDDGGKQLKLMIDLPIRHGTSLPGLEEPA